ncbi:MAG TPA: DUF222 domain-containing protein [Acidimicrobiia bacterium]|nr:DUF222 domain-containing protein [Acidimicrobiia bacterium]
MSVAEVTTETTAAAMPLERLEAELTELAGHLAAGECRWLLLVAEYDRRAGHETWGCRTVAHWLSWHCGLDMRSAREKVRVAHALEDLPLVTEEFAAGRLSYSKVRAITRVANPANEEQLVMYSQHATAAQTERIVRTYRRYRSPEEENEAANQLRDEQYLQVEYDLDGVGVTNGRMPPEIAAALLQALELARSRMSADQRGEGGPAGPPRSIGALNVDALAMIVETFMASEPAARNGSDRWMVGVNVDAEALIDDDPDAMCELNDGPALPVETVRRLFCDASTVALIRRENGEPLTVSKRTSSLPRSARRAARFRDKGCRFPNCGERVFVDVHHIHHQSRGGGHEHVNVIELCWFHHRLVHEGGWTVRFLEHDEVIAITPTGNVISSFVEPPSSARSPISERNDAAGVSIDATTITPNWWNDPLHLGDIIGGLAWHDEQGGAA